MWIKAHNKSFTPPFNSAAEWECRCLTEFRNCSRVNTLFFLYFHSLEYNFNRKLLKFFSFTILMFLLLFRFSFYNVFSLIEFIVFTLIEKVLKIFVRLKTATLAEG